VLGEAALTVVGVEIVTLWMNQDFRTSQAAKAGNRCAENQSASTIMSNERASYNGSIEASQASDTGSIPVARSN
jgi:hypothetical protein